MTDRATAFYNVDPFGFVFNVPSLTDNGLKMFFQLVKHESSLLCCF